VAAVLVGPIPVVTGTATRTIAIPNALIGQQVTFRVSLTGATLAGDITATVEASDDGGVTWRPFCAHKAGQLLSTNADLQPVDASSGEYAVTLPTNLRITLVSTAAATFTAETL